LSILQIPTPRAFVPLLNPARYKGAHGGRGSGKSHFFGEMLIERSIGQKIDAVCVREVQKSLDQSVKKLLDEKIASLNAGAYFESQDAKIKSVHGGVIIFQGMQNHTADSIKSLEGYDIGWVEEAQSLSQKSLDLLRPTIRKPGSELWFSWNPDQPTDPVDALLRGDNPPPDSVVVEVNYEDNPWFPDVLKAEMEYDRRRDVDKFNHIWRGGYNTKSESRVFRNWRIEEFDVKSDWIIRQGIDFGYSIDPSVLVQCAIVGKTLYVPYEAYMVGCEIDALPDLFMTVPGAEKWPSVADSARPETISYLAKHGFPKIFPAVKGAKSLEEGVQFLQTFDIVVHPRCKHTIDELTLYSYKTDPLTGKVLPVLEDKNNHVIDALRYANEGARRAGVNKPRPAAAKPVSWMG
jgi:phage terminase large subunit